MKLISTLLLALLLVNPSFAVVVGRVNIQKILVTVKQGKSVQGKLKKSFDKKQKILKAGEEKIKKEQQKFKKQSLVMNAKKKLEKQQAIDKQIMALQQQSVEFQKEMQGMEAKLKKPILLNIQEVIKSVSKDQGVDMTFEASTAAIIYAKNIKDLTNAVIKAYDKKHK